VSTYGPLDDEYDTELDDEESLELEDDSEDEEFELEDDSDEDQFGDEQAIRRGRMTELGEDPEHEEWEDEDNPDPYAPDEDDEEDDDDPADDDDQARFGSGELDGDPDSQDEDESSDEDVPDPASDSPRPVRPWTDPIAGREYTRGLASVKTIEEALDRINSSDAEFLYDCDRRAHSAYVLARVPGNDGVGPLLAASIHKALATAGVSVLRHGVRPGVARDGRRYDYFFRVEQQDHSLPSREVVRAALRRGQPTEEKEAAIAPEAASAADSPNAALERAHSELRQALERAADAERRALGVLHIQDRRLIGYRRRLAETEALVRDVLQTVAQAPVAGRQLDAIKESLRHAEEQLHRRNEEIEDALSLAAAEQNRARNVSDELAWYRKEREHLLARLDAIDSREQDESLGLARSDREQFIAQLLPEVCFLSDSIAVLWNETDRVGWLRDLALLVHNHKRFVQEIRGRGYIEKTEGKADWVEVRRTRSARDMSRLYYTDRLTPERRRWCTADHHWLVRLCIKTDKKQQSRDIAELP